MQRSPHDYAQQVVNYIISQIPQEWESDEMWLFYNKLKEYLNQAHKEKFLPHTMDGLYE